MMKRVFVALFGLVFASQIASAGDWILMKGPENDNVVCSTLISNGKGPPAITNCDVILFQADPPALPGRARLQFNNDDSGKMIIFELKSSHSIRANSADDIDSYDVGAMTLGSVAGHPEKTNTVTAFGFFIIGQKMLECNGSTTTDAKTLWFFEGVAVKRQQ